VDISFLIQTQYKEFNVLPDIQPFNYVGFRIEVAYFSGIQQK
jgi:hypothetical protein